MIGAYLTKKTRSLKSNTESGIIFARNLGISYVSFRLVKAAIGIPVGAVVGIMSMSPIAYKATKIIVGYPFGIAAGVVTFKLLPD